MAGTVGWHQGLAICLESKKRKGCVSTKTASAATKASPGLLQRRALISSFGAAIAAPCSHAAKASVSKKVRFKENPKMQEALRAAVAGDLETAEKLFLDLIQDEPQSASLWSNRGSVRISLGLFEDARTDLTQAIQIAPEAPVPLLNRAIALKGIGAQDFAQNLRRQGLQTSSQFRHSSAACKASIFSESLQRGGNFAADYPARALLCAHTTFKCKAFVAEVEASTEMLNSAEVSYPPHSSLYSCTGVSPYKLMSDLPDKLRLAAAVNWDSNTCRDSDMSIKADHDMIFNV